MIAMRITPRHAFAVFIILVWLAGLGIVGAMIAGFLGVR